jgi:hypothetical protein
MSSILKALAKKTQSRRPRMEEGFYHPSEGGEPRGGYRLTVILGVLAVILLLALSSLAAMLYFSNRNRAADISAEIKSPAYIPPAPAADTSPARDEKMEAMAAELAEMKNLLREYKQSADAAKSVLPTTVPAQSVPPKTEPQNAPVASPSEEATVVVKPEPPAATPTPPRKPAFQLNGTVSAGGKQTAFIGGSFYEAGDVVGGWKILEVGKGYVVVEGWPEKIWIQN